MKTESMKVINNEIYIGDYRVSELRDKFQTPLFVFDEVGLRKRLNDYITSFSSDDFNCITTYATKAFLCPYLLDILKEYNVYCDAVSDNDLYVLNRSGFDMQKVILHGNNKSTLELEDAINYNVGYIVVDNISELIELCKLTKEMKKTVKTLFRFNPGVEAHTHAFIQTSLLDSKFGESIFDDDKIEKIVNIYKENPQVIFDGIHSHIGSQITNPLSFEKEIEVLGEFARKITKKYDLHFQTIDFGGGFAIKYLDSDISIDIQEMTSKIIEKSKIEFRGLGIKNLVIEPGRSIVGDNCVTLYTAKRLKTTYSGVNYAFIDGGMTDNIRPSLYDAKYTVINATNCESVETFVYNVSGKCCESGDKIATKITLNKVRENDILLAFSTGAYCYSMSMNYNGLPKVGVVFVNNHKIVNAVRRETNEDMVKVFNFSNEIEDIKIFDTHSDMLYDLARKKNSGVNNRFRDYHVPQLKQSKVKGALWTMYSPDDFDLVHDLKVAMNEIHMEDLPNFKVILGLEGLRNLKQVSDIDEIYNLGFRHAMVTWNEENIYATGAKANPNRGITDLGKKLYKRMEELGMIIDLAHLNELSFYEALKILDKNNKNIIYSHGCCKKLCSHVRNLTDDQMMKLKEVDGLFGLTLANNFVSSDKDKQDLEHFLDHVDHAKSIMGVDNICFGFDFMDYLSEFPNSNIEDVCDATKTNRIIEGLINRGYTVEEVKKICYDNFYNRFKHLIYDFNGDKK